MWTACCSRVLAVTGRRTIKSRAIMAMPQRTQTLRVAATLAKQHFTVFHPYQADNIMANLYAIYQQPADEAAFDAHYFNKHVPLAKTIPGLRGYEVTQGAVMGMAGKHGAYLVATLKFDSIAAIQAGMASLQGQAVAADLANFASAGVDVMMGDTRAV